MKIIKVPMHLNEIAQYQGVRQFVTGKIYEKSPKGLYQFYRDCQTDFKKEQNHNSFYELKYCNEMLRGLLNDIGISVPFDYTTPFPLIVEYLNSIDFKRKLRR